MSKYTALIMICLCAFACSDDDVASSQRNATTTTAQTTETSGDTNTAMAGPEIISAAITPQAIPTTQVGMIDEFFTIAVSFSNFDPPPDTMTVSVTELNDREAVLSNLNVSGNTVTARAAYSLFAGADAGTYTLSVTLRSSDNTMAITQPDAATLEITP